MFEIFTEGARNAILEAQAEAQARRDRNLGCGHLLLGLLRDGTGLGAAVLAERSITVDAVRDTIDRLDGAPPPAVPADQALAAIGIDYGEVRARLEGTFGPDALADPPPPFTPLAKEALQLAVEEASRLDQRHVGTGHELLGLAQVTEGLAARALEQLGVDRAALVEELRRRAVSSD